MFRPEVAIDFVNFLKANDALERFDRNLSKKAPYNLILYLDVPHNIIGTAFMWGRTIEGSLYWGHLDEMWRELSYTKYSGTYYIDDLINEKFSGYYKWLE